jgi:predicted GIY-YIG superfamily endonuclease
LELIAGLITSPEKITPAMLRVKILAICEGRIVPTDRKGFVALARRAGVRYNRAYAVWQDEFSSRSAVEPGSVSVLPLRGPAREPSPETALYRWWDAADLLLYIGISDELSNRVNGHAKESSWMEFAARSTITRYPSRAEAAAAEVAAIKSERPLFNQKHNNSPEARQRLVEYLIEHERLDLLAPAVSRG